MTPSSTECADIVACGPLIFDNPGPDDQFQFYADSFEFLVDSPPPAQQFELCSNQIGCIASLPTGTPPLEAASIAFSWCGAATDFSDGRYFEAAMGGILTLADLIFFVHTSDSPNLAGLADCLEILVEAWHDNAIGPWADEVQQGLDNLVTATPGVLDFSDFFWSLWIASPVGITLDDGQGNAISVDGAGNVTLDPDFPGLAVGFGEHRKLLLAVADETSQFSAGLVGDGAAPGSTFRFDVTRSGIASNHSVTWLEVDTDEGALADLDMSVPPDSMTLVIDEDGDGTPDGTEPPDDVTAIEISVFSDGFESGDASAWFG